MCCLNNSFRYLNNITLISTTLFHPHVFSQYLDNTTRTILLNRPDGPNQNHLYRPESWSRTNNTFRLVIPAMVVGPRRAMSPSSIFGPLQNIYSLPCRWKDNSPLVHHWSVTKKEWISPSMSQWIKRGAPTHTQIYVYVDRSPREKKVRTHTGYSNTY